MRRSARLVAAILGSAVLAGLSVGCSARIDEDEASLPYGDTFEGGILQTAVVAGAPEGASGFVKVDDISGTMTVLTWPDVVGTDDEGAPCRARGEGLQWIEGTGEPRPGRFFVNLQLNCEPGPYWMTADGSASPVRLVDDAKPVAGGEFAPFGHQVSADGKWLVYALTTRDVDEQPYEDLYVVDTAGGTPRQITRLPPGLIPSFGWMPDGEDVIFAHRPFDGGDVRLYRVHAQTSSIGLIVDPRQPPPFVTDERAFGGPLAVSPDAQRMAFLVGGQLWLIDLGDGYTEQVAMPEAVAPRVGVTNLAWAPDGKHLSFASDHDGACDDAAPGAAEANAVVGRSGLDTCETLLYVYSIDEQQVQPLSETPQSAPLGMAWSPNLPASMLP